MLWIFLIICLVLTIFFYIKGYEVECIVLGTLGGMFTIGVFGLLISYNSIKASVDKKIEIITAKNDVI